MANEQTPTETYSDEELLAAEAELESAGILPAREQVNVEPEYSDEELLAAEEEMRQYGEDPKQIARAAAEAAARGASLGLSDVAAKELGVPDYEMYAREAMNPVISTTADIGTTVGLSLATGGSSLLAKGGVALGKKAVAKSIAANAIKAAGAPTKLLEATGKVVAKYADKAISKPILNKILKDTGRQKFVKDIIAKSIKDGAALATEGALYSGGRALSDDALGKEDLTAESFIAHVGTGALLGAGTGGALGIGKTIAPVFKNLGTGLSKKLGKAFDKVTSPEDAAMTLLGDIPSKVVKQQRYMPDYKARTVDYLRKLGTEVTSDSETIAAKSVKYLDSVGERIGTISKQLEDATKVNKLLMPRSNEFYKPMVSDLDRIIAENDVLGKASREAVAPIKKLRDEYAARAFKNERLTFDQINKERKFLGKMIGKLKRSSEPTLALEGASSAYGKYRGQIDNLVDNISLNSKSIETKQLLKEYRQLNKDYEIGTLVTPKLQLKAERGERASMNDLLTMLVSFDMLGAGGAAIGLGKLALKRNTLQNLAVKGDLARANQNIQNAIKAAVPKIVGTVKAGSRTARFTSLYALNESGFSTKRDEKSGKVKQAENKKEAFSNIRDNLSSYVSDLEKFNNSTTRGLYKLNAHVPGVGAYAAQTTTKAVQFLYDKMPKDPGNAHVQPWVRKFEPSSLDIAKFERYVQAVESPMTILDEAIAGTLTKEHVEAVQAVYPALYNQIRTDVLAALSTNEELNMSYNKKIQLGNLLNMNLDQSLSGAFIMDLQKPFIAQQNETEQSALAQAEKRPINTSKMTIADRQASGVQAAEKRLKS